MAEGQHPSNPYDSDVSTRDRKAPAEYLADPQDAFETGDLTHDAPPGAVAAQTIVRALTQAMTQQGRTLRTLAAATGINHTTIGRIIRGLTYPDVDTVARLQTALAVHLWPPDQQP